MLERLADYARYGIKPDEDAYVIKKHPITTFVAGIEKEASKALKSRKAAFLVMLSELESSPGTKFKTPESLRSLLAGMTEAAFHVQATTLVCKNRDWSGVSGAVQEMLAFHKLEYTVLCCDADSRMKSASKADALKALSSLIENRPGDNVLARDIAFTAMQWGMGGHAYKLLRRVTRMRPYEPQSWQQMATCLEAAGKTDLAMACYEVGLAGNWNARFGEFKKILTVDYLHFLKEIESGKQSVTNKDFAKMRLASLTNSQAHKPTDLLIIIGWNTDRSDVDLHVQEPSGEICFYKNPLTKLGGKITQDVTQGYGPEMYRLETAKSGIYQIKVKYFASDQNRATTRTKVYATIYRRWGSKNETVQRKTLTLERGKEMHQVATLQIGG